MQGCRVMSSVSGVLGLGGFVRNFISAAASGGWIRHAGRLALVAALAAFVAGCNQTTGGAGSRGIGGALQGLRVSQADIGKRVAVDPRGGRALIAVLAPVSGGSAEVGRSLANAAALAAKDVGDPSLTVKVYDTAGSPDGARAAAQQAVSEGAAMIVGPLFARSVIAAAPVAAQADLPMIAFSTDISVAGGNVFLAGILLESEIDRIIAYASRTGLRSMGALAPTTTQGEVAMRALAASTQRHGVRLVTAQRYVQDFKGIEEAVKRYADGHKQQATFEPVDSIFLADSGQALQSTAAYLAYYDIPPAEVKFLGAGIWNSSATRKEAALHGGWFAAPDPGPREAFAQRYSSSYGGRPHALAALAYDAVAAAGAMLDEARKKGDRYPFTVGAITAPSGFVGVNGVYRFRSDGLNDRGLAILEVGGSGFQVVDPAPKTFAGY